MRNIVLFIILMLFAGCATQKRCYQLYPPQIISDSIYIEKLKEMPVYLPGDTVNLIVPIKCPDQDVAVMENSKLKQVIRILNGKLSSITEIKSDTVKVFVKDINQKVKEVIIPPPVKYIPRIYLIAFWMDIGLLLAVALFIAWKIFKPKIGI